MTPYIKEIVELHKIHKAVENKDSNGGGSSDSSSKEITIDDIVKFLHDNWSYTEIEFPYTTYNEIPIMPENNIVGNTIYRDGINYGHIYFDNGDYIIGLSQNSGGR